MTKNEVLKHAVIVRSHAKYWHINLIDVSPDYPLVKGTCGVEDDMFDKLTLENWNELAMREYESFVEYTGKRIK
jgi:hypothetical protein